MIVGSKFSKILNNSAGIICLFIVCLLFINCNEKNFEPILNNDITLGLYDDRESNGASISYSSSIDSRLKIQYIFMVDSGFAYPYAGVSVFLDSSAETNKRLACSDFTKYDSLEIKYSSKKCQRLCHRTLNQ